jgi:iron complex transport system substrate-binding protein
MVGMRIVSLLPSATEIVCALGLGDDLVGVTHECDWPVEATTKQVVSRSALPAVAEPAEIDRLVSESAEGGDPIYTLDTDAIRELRPELVLTQDLCAVCAVPAGHVQAALDVLGCPAAVISLDPGGLDDTLDCIQQVGDATGAGPRAARMVASLRHRLAAVRAAVSDAGRPRTFALEWGDPPFNGGHWVPEMIRGAGGEPVLASERSPSIRLTWQEIAAAEPTVVVFMPCGYGLDAAVHEGRSLVSRDELASARDVFAVDANAYFSRPGPRLVDGVEILAAALHPGSVPAPPAGAIARIR